MVEYAKNYQDRERQVGNSKKSISKYTALDSLGKGFSEKYIEAFATFLKATPFQFTLLASLPQFIGGFVQLFANEILAFFKKRKTMQTIIVIFQGLSWIPIIWIALKHNEHSMWIYILVITCYFVFSLLENPLWNSWVMDVIDPDSRGKFFSRKAKIVDFVTLISFVAGGFILQRAVNSGTNVDWTFAGLFMVSVISNFASVYYARKTYDPPVMIVKKNRSFKDFVKLIKETNHGSVILYLSLISFSMYIAEPFFTVYLLSSMGFSYVQFVILAVIPLIVRMVLSDRIGRIIDRYGPKKVLIVTSILMVFNPLLWLYGSSFMSFVFIRIFTGFSFGIYEISSAAFFMNETNSSNRMDLLSYFNFVNGFFIILGALSANLFLHIGPFDNIFLNAFMWSGIFRFVVLIFMFPRRIKEKDHYHSSSVIGLGWQMVFEDKPKELITRIADVGGNIPRMFKGNEGVSTKIKDKWVHIDKRPDFAVDPKSRIVKKKPKIVKTKVYEYIKYACEKCNQTYRRHAGSHVDVKCPFCGSKEHHFVGYEEEHS